MGRPSKYSAERAAQIVEAVRGGHWFEDACLDAGVSPSTVNGWVRAGDEAGEGGLYEFACALRKARREANAPHLANIHSAEEKDWKAAAWYLERKERKRFGPQVKVEIDSVFDRVIAALAEGLNADEFERVTKIIDSALSSETET